MIVLNVMNSKGGVGKTTTATTFAVLTAQLGLQTLFVDMAPQANGSSIFVDHFDEYNICNFLTKNGNFKSEEELVKYVKDVRDDPDFEEIEEYLHIITSNLQLNIIKENLPSDGYSLKKGLDLLEDFFDVVIIDNDPGLDILAKNSLVASTAVVIPIKMDYFSFNGSKDLLSYIRDIKKDLNPGLEIKGFLPTLFKNVLNDKTVLEQFQIYYNRDFILTTVIRDRTSASKALTFRLPLPIFDKSDDCVLDYKKALLELNILDEEHQEALKEDTLKLSQKLSIKKERKRKSKK